DCRVIVPGSGRIGGAGSCPTVSGGIVSVAGVHLIAYHCPVTSAPKDHFAPGPHSCVVSSGSGRVGGTGGCPTIGAGIISPASVKKVVAAIISGSAPDNHFAPGPHSRVQVPPIGRVGSTVRCPTVGAGVITPVSVN